MHKTLTESSNEAGLTTARRKTRRPNPSTDTEPSSTLVEFPGARNVPEWRKRLSQRVREVQEQKAREAAEVDAVLRAAETVTCALPSGQLELVPDRDQPPMNPIVTKALQRVERARRSENLSAGYRSAAATALAPIEDESPSPALEPAAPKPKLTIVTSTLAAASEQFTAPETTPESAVAQAEDPTDRPKRVGVISASVEDAALSYLETCLSVPAHTGERRSDLATLTRRTVVGGIDLLLLAVMISPAAAAIQVASGDWLNPRVIALMAGVAVLTMFAYLTISIALTGRTLAMRMLSVRTIDERTGLIPTGGQSITRAVTYIFSLGLLGLGLAFAFIDRERRTLHDRFSKTIVVRS